VEAEIHPGRPLTVRARLHLSAMDRYSAARALEFFMETDDLVDYEAVNHALSRLRHQVIIKVGWLEALPRT
jgi:hypothetical protein